jgi:hypothetical protein
MPHEPNDLQSYHDLYGDSHQLRRGPGPERGGEAAPSSRRDK